MSADIWLKWNNSIHIVDDVGVVRGIACMYTDVIYGCIGIIAPVKLDCMESLTLSTAP